eukprot:gene6261-2889_t
MALNTLTAVVLTELIVLLTTVIFMEPVSDLDTPEKVAKAIVLLVSLIVLTALFTIYFMQSSTDSSQCTDSSHGIETASHGTERASRQTGRASHATETEPATPGQPAATESSSHAIQPATEQKEIQQGHNS